MQMFTQSKCSLSDQVPANVHCPRRRLSHKDGRVESLHGLCTKLHALSFQGTKTQIIVDFVGQERSKTHK